MGSRPIQTIIGSLESSYQARQLRHRRFPCRTAGSQVVSQNVRWEALPSTCFGPLIAAPS